MPVDAAAREEEALAAFPGYDEPAVREALDGATRQTFEAGAAIVREGDPADAFYLLEEGSVEVTKAAPGDAGGDSGRWRVVRRSRPAAAGAP